MGGIWSTPASAWNRLTNNFKIECPSLLARYAQRMIIENGISEAIQSFHIDSLPSKVGMKVDCDLQITHTAGSLCRLMAKRAHNPYLVASGLAKEPTPIPRFGGRRLGITFA